jgi:hypothetical protein
MRSLPSPGACGDGFIDPVRGEECDLSGNTLAGVTSGGYPNCSGTLSWETNVVPFLPWILSRLL